MIVYLIGTNLIEGILTWKGSCLGDNELRKVAFRLSEDKIAEFLTKTERKKGKNTQNILFDGCYLRFEEHLREKQKNIGLYPETEPRNRSNSLRGGKIC